MRVSICNLTTEDILLSTNTTAILAPQSLLTTLPAVKAKAQLVLSTPHGDSEPFVVRLPSLRGTSWKAVSMPAHYPWRIYCTKVEPSHCNLLIIPRRSLASFLSDMPDSLSLSALLLPGTHDTMAFYGWPISQCQTPATPLASQLQSGIRVIDIRLAVITTMSPSSTSSGTTATAPTPKHQLIAYHGLYPQRTPFPNILQTIHNFLISPEGSRETIVMSIKQEDFAVTPTKLFSRLVRETMMASSGGWSTSTHDTGMYYLQNRIPQLGEVRGKVVLFSRFGGDGAEWDGGLEGIGIHPTTWPDSEKEGFEWELKGTIVRTHDWYAVPSFLSIPEKVARATEVLLPPTCPQPTLSITYFSAASFPFALPPTIACGFGWPALGLGVEGVNIRVGRWLLDILTGTEEKRTQSVKAVHRRPRWLRKHHEGLEPIPSDANLSLNVGEKGMQEFKEDMTRLPVDAEEPRLRGWALMDYFVEPEGGNLVPLLVECNYRGRKVGEEGWQ